LNQKLTFSFFFFFSLSQSNLIEAGDTKRDSEKEWYFSDGEKTKKGPYSAEEVKEFFTAGKVKKENKIKKILQFFFITFIFIYLYLDQC